MLQEINLNPTVFYKRYGRIRKFMTEKLKVQEVYDFQLCVFFISIVNSIILKALLFSLCQFDLEIQFFLHTLVCNI